jgi:uracil-DNA glycosylase
MSLLINKEEKLRSLLGEWYDILKEEFDKPYMIALSRFLAERRNTHKVFPDSSLVFNAYKQTPFSKVKVCILGQDPYINEGEAMGMCFSVPESTIKIPPSLSNIQKEIEANIKDGLDLNFNPDLTRWARQGVFLLNTILTVDKGSSLSHSKLGWQEFTTKTIISLNQSPNTIVYLLWGGNARDYVKYIDLNKHKVLTCGHPSPLSANKGFWFGNKHFSITNQILRETGQKEIKW